MTFQALFVIAIASVAYATPFVTNSTTGVSYQGTLAHGVEEFQNIFFGQSTSGERRFAPPELYIPPENTIVDATGPGAACPQPVVPTPGLDIFSNVSSMSEDCLNLRIARPENTSADAKLPVMVWIYGGGYTFGQIYDQLYTPTGLVLQAAANDQPVIYVAVNYRLNIFGFASSDALRKMGSLNVGLKDQRLGIQWVKDNIAAFGGDPDNITLFGESVGAVSVGLQMTAYGGKRGASFHRGIMESGSPAAQSGVNSNISAVNFAAVADLTNCTLDGPGSVETLACLRNLTMQTLLDVALKHAYDFRPPFGFLVYYPVVDNDFIPEAPSTLVKTGAFSKNISAIIGWNADEGSLFTPSTIANDSAVIDSLSSDFPGLTNDTITQILALYPVSDFASQVLPNDTVNAQYYRASRMWRDITFTCTAIDLSYNVMKHSSADTWLYEFNQTSFGSQLPAYFGVPHISDVPYVFNEVSGSNASASDILLGAQMSGNWSAFSATGKPTKATVWPIGYPSVNFATKGAVSPTEAIIDVIGGPYTGPTTIYTQSSEGPLGEQKLLQRCAFLNGIYDELRV